MDIQEQPHKAVRRPIDFIYGTDELGFRLPTRIALKIADKAGDVTMFYALVIWQLFWMVIAEVGVGPFKHDRYPFSFLLFLGNLIQLWYLPLLQIQAKRDAKAANLKAEADHKAMTHIANVVDLIADHLDIDSPAAPLPPISNPNYQPAKMQSLGLGWDESESDAYLDMLANEDENVANF